MTLTPLHAAFVWILKPHFKWLSFAALTVGSFIPDLEPLAAFVFGWSVFCGWDFPCSLAPDRLIMHSLVGALTIDVAVTMAVVKALGMTFVMKRFGIYGFERVKVLSTSFYASAAIGSISHNLVDWFHHPANPVFWPLQINGSYYLDGLLLPYFSVLHASIIVGAVAAALMAVSISMANYRSGRSFSYLLTNPTAALGVLTSYLSRDEKSR